MVLAHPSSALTQQQAGGLSATISYLLLSSSTCPDTTTTVVEVESPVNSGMIWMDRNLGASQAATSSTDTDSYGDLFQWGRCAEGHQIRTSSTTRTNATTGEPSLGNSWDGEFIIASDWLTPQDDMLWQGVTGANNPCPAGYRLPTFAEISAESGSWNPDNFAGAFDSPLKWPVAGSRSPRDGSLSVVGSQGIYWSSTVSDTAAAAYALLFGGGNTLFGAGYRANGFSVRCIKG